VVKAAVEAKHTDLIAWVRALPLYWETDTHIWLHAGVEEDLGEDWKLGTSDHTLTHKFPPTFGKVLTKTVVAGHVSTEPMHSDGSHGIFTDAGHIFLDGGTAKNGDLNVPPYDCESGSYEHHVLR
jgi:serine/threonine protein phosphatase 1